MPWHGARAVRVGLARGAAAGALLPRIRGGGGVARGMHGIRDMLSGMLGNEQYTGSQRPGMLSPGRPVPAHIPKPDYYDDGRPKATGPMWGIVENTQEEIELAREACRISREVLDIAGAAVRVGMKTDELDEIVHNATIERGAYPSPLNYHGFPKSVCTSINEIVCHGIPDVETSLLEGDIVNIDVSCYYNGFHGDNSEMFCVGEVDEDSKRLITVTYNAWQRAIGICQPGVPFNKIGAVIEEYVAEHGMTTTRNFCGHGVGRVFHMNPQIVHYKTDLDLGVMTPGNIFTIEPMIQLGTDKNVMWRDGWTVATKDGGRSAQFEHTLLITDTGVEVLTKKTDKSPRPFWEAQALLGSPE